MKTHSTAASPPRRAALLTFLLAAAAFVPAGRAGTFTEFVGTAALPGQNPAIANVSTDGSAAALIANLTNAAGVPYQAIYYVGGPGAAPAFIADTQTTQSPTGGGVFTDFDGLVLSGTTIVFQADVQTNQTQNSGIYIATVGGGLSVAADSNTTNPLDPTGDLTGDSKLNKIYGGFDF